MKTILLYKKKLLLQQSAIRNVVKFEYFCAELYVQWQLTQTSLSVLWTKIHFYLSVILEIKDFVFMSRSIKQRAFILTHLVCETIHIENCSRQHMIAC